MNYRKYKIDNNIIHELIINNIFDIKNIIDYEKSKSIFNINDDFFNEFINKYSVLNKYKFDVNMRYNKEYKNYGTTPNLNKIISNNINCYKNNCNNDINVYYDLVNKYNSEQNIEKNRFIIIYYLVRKLEKLGYNVNFIPVLFLKAFENNSDNNEYVYIKINKLNIDDIFKCNIISNKDITRIILPELVSKLDIENIEALDYNGYLLERYEKENIINLNNNDMIIDFFTSEELFNGNIEHDSEAFYKKLSLRNT